MTADEEYAYSRGYDAWLAGDSQDDCPYDTGSGEAKEWLNGWKCARDMNA